MAELYMAAGQTGGHLVQLRLGSWADSGGCMKLGTEPCVVQDGWMHKMACLSFVRPFRHRKVAGDCGHNT